MEKEIYKDYEKMFEKLKSKAINGPPLIDLRGHAGMYNQDLRILGLPYDPDFNKI